ncbi:MAG TPA: hypothetical protein DCS67_12225 [Clostridiales bacterium UBA8960]|jgi:uncharacterized protein|nr:hypothetical protein [Clostridiales bacterium UBA8960]
MNLDLSKVIKGLQNQADFENNLELEKSFLESIECINASVIKILGHVKKIDRRYELTLSYSGDLVFECHRCLKNVNINLENTVERVLVTAFEAEENEEFILIKDGVLDLMPVLEEDITLNLPLQILCNEDCAGLCPQCGKDLNNGMCECDETKIDPRLEALKNLFT